jgi:hypothetical protein
MQIISTDQLDDEVQGRLAIQTLNVVLFWARLTCLGFHLKNACQCLVFMAQEQTDTISLS